MDTGSRVEKGKLIHLVENPEKPVIISTLVGT